MVGQLFLQLIWTTLPGRPLRRWKSRRIVKNNLDHLLGPASCQEELSRATSFANDVNPSPEWVGATSETRTRLSVKRSVPYSEQLLDDFLWHRMQSFPKDKEIRFESSPHMFEREVLKTFVRTRNLSLHLEKRPLPCCQTKPCGNYWKRLKLLLTRKLF